jgi:hypothetical protein
VVRSSAASDVYKRQAKIHINHLKSMNCNLSPAEITAFLQIDLELNALGICHWLDKS